MVDWVFMILPVFLNAKRKNQAISLAFCDIVKANDLFARSCFIQSSGTLA